MRQVTYETLERELLIDSFTRYVSRDVLRQLLARGELELGGQRRVCSIMFADIRGFSAIAEQMTPALRHPRPSQRPPGLEVTGLENAPRGRYGRGTRTVPLPELLGM